MRIGIVGIGLIGSSLARAFRSKTLAHNVAIYDNNPKHMAEAEALDLAGCYCRTLDEVAENNDFIFVCTPIPAVADTIKTLAAKMPKGGIITDVASVKSSIIDAVGALPGGISFVPGHPIAGTEHSGPAAGSADLFKGKPYILIDNPAKQSAATGKIAEIIGSIGANPVFMDAATHDKTYALLSHIQHVVAYSMMNCAADMADNLGFDPLALAGSSFNGTTRVAGTNPELWVDVFRNNPQHLRAVYDMLRTHMDGLMADIDAGSGERIFSRLQRGHKAKLHQSTGK